MVLGDGVTTAEQSKVILQVRVWEPEIEHADHSEQLQVSSVQDGASGTILIVTGLEQLFVVSSDSGVTDPFGG